MKNNLLRIIGGEWRSRKLKFADVPGLRPTPDRVRETLFNWLQWHVPGARCLDLFAGSGALGLESLSRGAQSATLVERDAGLATNLREVVSRLNAGASADIVHADALSWLDRAVSEGRRYDIAFIDPPFAGDLWSAAIAGIHPLMAEDAWLYVETPANTDIRMPTGWLLHREGGTREVAYRLWRRSG